MRQGLQELKTQNWGTQEEICQSNAVKYKFTFEDVVAGAAVRKHPNGICIQGPVLIGSTAALETLRAPPAVSIIMPTALSFLDAD